MISTLMKKSNHHEQLFGWVKKGDNVLPQKVVTWSNKIQYLWVVRISLESIIAFGKYLEEKYDGQIPHEEMIALNRDLKNHNELLGIGSELHKRNMNLKAI